MAYTATIQKKTVFGNQRVEQYLVTADAASGSVTTGLSVVESAGICPVSMATAGIKVKINTSAASAAANGQVLVSSAVSGDAFFLTVYGR